MALNLDITVANLGDIKLTLLQKQLRVTNLQRKKKCFLAWNNKKDERFVYVQNTVHNISKSKIHVRTS